MGSSEIYLPLFFIYGEGSDVKYEYFFWRVNFSPECSETGLLFFGFFMHMRRRTAEGADTADDPADKRRRTDLPLLPNVLAFIPSFSMELYNYQPIRGSSWIPTPSKLAGKRAIINVKNLKDEKCIIYSILASTRGTDIKRGRGSRASSYTPFIDDLNTSGLSYPTPINEIRRFETVVS